MIKASELRIGNWVECNVSGMITIPKLRNEAYNPDALRILETFKDTKLRVGSVFDGGAGCGQGYPNETGLVYFSEDHMDGILLTSEILDANDLFEHEGFVGANREYEVDNYTLGDFRLSFASFGGLVVICKSQSVENIKYVHQLQNLFYCLTGQELDVKI